MRILVACEESQAVTIELRKLGYIAYSCDILPCSGGHPEWHIQDDVLKVMNQGWDMIIGFPPCTDLALSGAAHFEKKRGTGSQRESIIFFMELWNADCPRICLENPMNIIGGKYILRHFPDIAERYGLPLKKHQTIQPYQFGDPYQKTTWLWLKNLPKLKPTKIVGKGEFSISPKGKRRPKWLNYNHNNKKDRQSSRSVTFQGIAKAMATQFTYNYLDELLKYDIL